MRRSKQEHRLMPFAAGLISGYITTLITAAAGAFFLLLTDTAEAMAGTVAITAMLLSCFVAGHTAGHIRRHGGLAAGALCGVLYMVLPLLISLLTFNASIAVMAAKLTLCITAGAAGGVFGVNTVK